MRSEQKRKPPTAQQMNRYRCKFVLLNLPPLKRTLQFNFISLSSRMQTEKKQWMVVGERMNEQPSVTKELKMKFSSTRMKCAVNENSNLIYIFIASFRQIYSNARNA